MTLSGLQGDSKFSINGDLLTSDGLIEHKVKFYDLNDTGTTNEITYRIDAHTVLRDTSYWETHLVFMSLM